MHGEKLTCDYNIVTCQRIASAPVDKHENTPKLLIVYDNIIKVKRKQSFIEQVQDDSTTDVHYIHKNCV